MTGEGTQRQAEHESEFRVILLCYSLLSNGLARINWGLGGTEKGQMEDGQKGANYSVGTACHLAKRPHIGKD